MSSYGPWEQVPIFDAEPPVPRPPGWHLIANNEGTQGWHLVRRTTPDRGVVTVCGVVGRVIQNESPTIQRCVTCQDWNGST